MQPKVSIVIPVYNVEKYLKKCIDSVINQTLKEIEIICIDDGSIDSCPRILDEYASKDNRIKVVHKENGGYGNAMNVGFDLAEGEFIGIVESDDYILPNMYEVLYKKAKEHRLDFVKSDYCLIWEVIAGNIRNKIWYLENYYNQVLTEKNREPFFYLGINNWTGIYNREFINKNNIRHHETAGASYQDIGFWFQVMSFAERAMWLDEAFYMYRQDNPSSSVKNTSKMMAGIGEYDFVENILREKGLYSELRICNFYRIREYKLSFDRLDTSLKLEYAKIIKEDYQKYKDNIGCKDNLEYEKSINWVENICKNPEVICNEIISSKEKFDKNIREAHEIIIYGAGQKAHAAIAKLYDLGYYDRILNVCISGKVITQKIMGIEVKNVEELLAHKDKLVLVAVKKGTNAYDEIIENLKQYGFTNYLDVEFL